ncbi:MAG TPA: Ig-like domain-containing protein [Gemmatimonadales bacterium]|nr:Ig-like domain-containing protein [Gemmatimonadales bacterium]
MSRAVLLALLVLGCSDLTEEPGGVVALEISIPTLLTIEVGEMLDLSARALNKDGDSVAAEVTWVAPDPTLTVEPATGLITGVAPGTGRVQALSGSLSSQLVQFNVIARADTLIVTDSIFTVAPGVAASPPLVAQLQTLSPAAAPLPDRPVEYVIIGPVDGSVTLPGGVLIDTLNTGTDGAVSGVTLNRVNLAQSISAVVQVNAYRTRGALVPGTGQRFTVTFQ